MTRDTVTRPLPSHHTSAAGIVSVCEGVQDLTATQFRVPQGQKVLVFGRQGVIRREAHTVHEHEEVRHRKGRGWFGRSRDILTI